MSPDVRDLNDERRREAVLAVVISQAAAVMRNDAPGAHAGNGQAGSNPEHIALRGPEFVANKNGTNVPCISDVSDADLAQSAVSLIERCAQLPVGQVRPMVRNGWLILEGEVEGRPQRRAVEDAMKGLDGIRGVSNNILIESEALAMRVSQKIDETFVRSARISAHRISVTASDHKIILSGCARSSAEREEAEIAAWAVRGVAHVVNRIRAAG